jgi:2-polyprenyl-3-methyl-5-hydroxy-6-metoxy-1,4-benzoquinol methylase
MTEDQGYDWSKMDYELPSHSYLAPAVKAYLHSLPAEAILDLGCGDGRLTAELHNEGLPIEGVDFSRRGIEKARREHPDVTFHVQDIAEPFPLEAHRKYDLVVSVEVIEHLLLPRNLFRRADEILSPGGQLLVTTPYHGYLKNLALSVAGKWDKHFTVHWDYGHIKFFSPATLEKMANEMGFELVKMQRVGRIPILAASMVATFARR